MSYGTAFKPIKFMKEWYTYPHIYYGCARVYRTYKEGGYLLETFFPFGYI